MIRFRGTKKLIGPKKHTFHPKQIIIRLHEYWRGQKNIICMFINLCPDRGCVMCMLYFREPPMLYSVH